MKITIEATREDMIEKRFKKATISLFENDIRQADDKDLREYALNTMSDLFDYDTVTNALEIIVLLETE